MRMRQSLSRLKALEVSGTLYYGARITEHDGRSAPSGMAVGTYTIIDDLKIRTRPSNN